MALGTVMQGEVRLGQRPGYVVGERRQGIIGGKRTTIGIGQPGCRLGELFLSSNPIYLFVLFICVVGLMAGRRKGRSSGRPPRRPAPGEGGRRIRGDNRAYRRQCARSSEPLRHSASCWLALTAAESRYL